jgi:beta-xylosidase
MTQRTASTAEGFVAEAEGAHRLESNGEPRPWGDLTRDPHERVEYLLTHMTINEKISQLVGLWVGSDSSGAGVAPYQHDMSQDPPLWEDVIAGGLGQLTRFFGTRPVEPGVGARSLAASQAQVVAANRWGIPAVAHEECLTGFAAWRATNYPVPLAWGASFDPALVEEMAALIGASMRSVGVHQGLAPVLDVTRDYRWGRTEETIGEDPYLVATIATHYVRGLQSAGVVATLKHFAGYSASRAGRNHAPVSMGPREFADVILPPFEMAIREGGARSVMHSYAAVDGVPAAANRELLTGLLREQWGFTGTVVADYFAVKFLQSLHGVADSEGEAASLALTAGVDVELPSVHCFGSPLAQGIGCGRIAESVIDDAVRRVLLQKCELGLLDDGWSPEPPTAPDAVDLDSPRSRGVALRLAQESIVLLKNTGVLPLTGSGTIAVVGPRADDPMAMLGCYSFPAHVGVNFPEEELGVELLSLLDALREELPDPQISYALGCDVTGPDRSGFEPAVAAARDADVCIVAVGDRAGLFGRGTSGEGCDAADLRLPGVQEDLVRALIETGTPVVVVLLSGRPYALGPIVGESCENGEDGGKGCAGAAAVVQAFFPGQLGGTALAQVLTGAVNPSGRLPVSVPRETGSQPGTYLSAPLGRRTEVSNIDPTPLFGFGHGLNYSTFEWSNLAVRGESSWRTDGSVRVGLTVANTSLRSGTDVVQLYLHDPVAQVTRPVTRLIGYARVPLRPGESADVEFEVAADVTSFTGKAGQRVVEPGAMELRFGASCMDIRNVVALQLEGPERVVDHTRVLSVPVVIIPLLVR